MIKLMRGFSVAVTASVAITSLGTGFVTVNAADKVIEDGIYYGTAVVEKFGYSVNAAVTVADGVIASVDITGSNLEGALAEYNADKLQLAADGLKDAWNGKTASQDNVKDIYEFDAVSSATYSSEAIRNAVMDALSLVCAEEDAGDAEAGIPDAAKDGVYTVQVALYQESADSVSMGNMAFEENTTAVITIKDGIPTIRIKTNPVTISPYYSALEGMQFKNANGQWQYVSPAVTETITATDGENDYELEYLKELEFVLPSVAETYVPVKICVPYTPMAMIGDEFGYVAARLRIDWNTLSKAVVINSAEPDGNNVKVSVSNVGETVSGTAVLAYYDAQEMLLGSAVQSVDAVNRDTEIVFENEADNYSRAAKVKVMLWDSLNSMKPLADKYELEPEQVEVIGGFGSSHTGLETGIYSVTVSMKKATDISQSSMATECIAGSRLSVLADGTAELTIDLRPITVGTITASSSGWSIYQSYGTDNGDNIPAEYTTDEDGNVNQITFKIPDNSWDGVYVNMTSDGTHYSNAYLAIDYANAEPVSDAEVNKGFGSAQTELEEGSYSIPVTMKNASDISKDSMANACIAGAQLYVLTDGTAELTIDLRPITVGTITASSSGWSIYQSYGTDNGDNIPAEYTTDEDGNVNQITFKIPDNSWDGVYVNMTSDGTHYSNAYLAIDYANAAAVTDQSGNIED
ncbi:MAG: FMN-binding protein [Candidatus Ornithomonoglobus sp.]